MPNQLDIRLHALKAVDAILAALQSTFARPEMLGLDDAYRFNRDDVKGSKVWICDPESKTGFERGTNRMLITVSRGEFQPLDMHFLNKGQSSFSDPTQNFTDLCRTPVTIACEAGNKLQSEMLASVVYQILKFFRSDLMKEFDLMHLSVNGVSSPMQVTGVTGNPWITQVSVRLETQEMFQLTELFNDVNKLEIMATIKNTAITAFDSKLTTPDFDSPAN
jgi:hypothetical protein